MNDLELWANKKLSGSASLPAKQFYANNNIINNKVVH